ADDKPKIWAAQKKFNQLKKSDIKSMEVKTTVLKSPKKSKNEQTIIKLAQIIKRELFRQKVKRDKPIYKYMNELIIIRTENSKELKAFLQKKRIDYETYPYDAKQTHREKWLKDIDLANKDEKLKRGEIWLVRFKKKKSLGTEIWKDRPALIISADWQNAKNGKIMTDQVHSFDKKKRLVRKLGILPEETLKKVEETLQELLDQGTLEIAKNADLVIQPVGASNDDLMPAVKEFNALKKAGINKNKLLFVLTRLSTPKEAEAIKEYLKDTAYSFTNNYLSEKTSYKQTQNEGRSITEVNKIKRKGLGIAPQEASENIQASELAPRDKRFTGRTKQLGLSVKPEFSKRLKMIAAEEDCFVIEVLEKA
ncbi:10469_t:CDS:2, partial [Entrophospora sp. SA101]